MLSIFNRSLFKTLKRENKTAEAKALAIKEHSDLSDTYDTIKIGDRKISEDLKQLKKTRGIA